MLDKCLIFGFQSKPYKMEAFEKIILLRFHSGTNFICNVFHFSNIQNCLIWMLLQIKIAKMMTKNGHTEC